jgi:hypothetical protein
MGAAHTPDHQVISFIVNRYFITLGLTKRTVHMPLFVKISAEWRCCMAHSDKIS